MTTNPRFRAGQPASCAFVQSGCNAPESECLGLCMHRVDSRLEDSRAFVVLTASEIEYADDEPMSLLVIALILTAAAVGIGFIAGRYFS